MLDRHHGRPFVNPLSKPLWRYTHLQNCTLWEPFQIGESRISRQEIGQDCTGIEEALQRCFWQDTSRPPGCGWASFFICRPSATMSCTVVLSFLEPLLSSNIYRLLEFKLLCTRLTLSSVLLVDGRIERWFAFHLILILLKHLVSSQNLVFSEALNRKACCNMKNVISCSFAKLHTKFYCVMLLNGALTTSWA